MEETKRKIRIFAYVGSYKQENSKSLITVKYLINEIEKQFKISTESLIYTPKNININDCIGCNNCFLENACPQNDDINKIKKEMLNSDIIIFSSPVFLHQVPGNMKNFLDRIASWTHLLKLRGKLGIIISSASSNGTQEVNNYLTHIMEYLGLMVIGCLSFTASDFIDEKVYKSIIQHYVRKAKKKVLSRSFSFSENQRIYFKNMKFLLKNNSLNSFEKNYWNTHKFAEYPTYEKLFIESFENQFGKRFI